MGLAKKRASFIGIRTNKSRNTQVGEGGREPTSNKNRGDMMRFGV